MVAAGRERSPYAAWLSCLTIPLLHWIGALSPALGKNAAHRRSDVQAVGEQPYAVWSREDVDLGQLGNGRDLGPALNTYKAPLAL